MTQIAKSLIGIGIAGSGVGLTIGGYHLFKSSEPTTLKEKLQRENLKVLNYWAAGSEDNQYEDYALWATNLTKYNQAGNDQKLPELNENSIDQQRLRDECKKHLEKSLSEIKDNSLEDKVKQWCTVAKDGN